MKAIISIFIPIILLFAIFSFGIGFCTGEKVGEKVPQWDEDVKKATEEMYKTPVRTITQKEKEFIELRFATKSYITEDFDGVFTQKGTITIFVDRRNSEGVLKIENSDKAWIGRLELFTNKDNEETFTFHSGTTTIRGRGYTIQIMVKDRITTWYNTTERIKF